MSRYLYRDNIYLYTHPDTHEWLGVLILLSFLRISINRRGVFKSKEEITLFKRIFPFEFHSYVDKTFYRKKKVVTRKAIVINKIVWV